jgi:hypothetical protein
MGEIEFLACDDTGIKLTADGAGDATTNTFTFDALTVPNGLEKYHIIQNGSELMLVTDAPYSGDAGSVTIQRGAYQTTPTPWVDNQVMSVRNHAKIALLEKATTEIVAYHRQYLSEGLWFYGSPLLKRACACRAMYLYKYREPLGIAEWIRNLTFGSYSDGVLSTSGAAKPQLDARTMNILNDFMRRVGLGSFEYGRA